MNLSKLIQFRIMYATVFHIFNGIVLITVLFYFDYNILCTIIMIYFILSVLINPYLLRKNTDESIFKILLEQYFKFSSPFITFYQVLIMRTPLFWDCELKETSETNMIDRVNILDRGELKLEIKNDCNLFKKYSNDIITNSTIEALFLIIAGVLFTCFASSFWNTSYEMFSISVINFTVLLGFYLFLIQLEGYMLEVIIRFKIFRLSHTNIEQFKVELFVQYGYSYKTSLYNKRRFLDCINIYCKEEQKKES